MSLHLRRDIGLSGYSDRQITRRPNRRLSIYDWLLKHSRVIHEAMVWRRTPTTSC